jgi:hypothetical protein
MAMSETWLMSVRLRLMSRQENEAERRTGVGGNLDLLDAECFLRPHAEQRLSGSREVVRRIGHQAGKRGGIRLNRSHDEFIDVVNTIRRR